LLQVFVNGNLKRNLFKGKQYKKKHKKFIRKEDSDNVEYILKRYNEFTVDNDIRNYLYDIGSLFVGKKQIYISK